MTSVEFSFWVGQPPVALTSDDPQWRAALPLDRRSAASGPLPAGRSFSYGDYFTAVRHFLSRNEMTVVVNAAAVLAEHPCAAADIDHIAVQLAKHGAFYHPAKVVVTAGADRFALVVNVALSAAGRSALAREHAALEHLSMQTGGLVPRVFGHAAEQVADFDLELFAAEWLDGFCEFHLRGASDGTLQWQVWGEQGERWNLSTAQTDDLYRQAAGILTACFNPLTFEGIRDWHHAAGDFIVKPEPDGLKVRLITVRRYAPLIARDADQSLDLEQMLDGLAAFFVSMSLRMRIDRLEGVGELAWAPETILPSVWRGFADGLDGMAAAHELPPEFGALVRRYLAAHPPDALQAIGDCVAARYPAVTGERRLVEQGLADHLRALTRIMIS